MITILKYGFAWMPTPMYVLMGIVLDLFFLAALWRAINLLLDLAKLVIGVFGGVIAKVAGWFL